MFDFEGFPDAEREQVAGIFGDAGVQSSTGEQFGDLYWIPPEQQAEVLQGLDVDPRSVNGRS